jgi:hypothetical protein
VPSDSTRLNASAIWQDMLTALRPGLWTMFAVAAPFTLLVDMVLSVFGPEPPRTMREMTGSTALLLFAIPALIGAIAQLAVVHLVARPDAPPRQALAAAFAAAPVYIVALLITAIPTGFGFLLLVVPGLYIVARLFTVLPVAILEPGPPMAIIRRSWNLTAPHGWRILWFLVLALLFLFGATMLVTGVSAALASVLTLMGAKGVGVFVAALLPAVLSTVLSIASATASTVVYLRLR